VSDTQSRARQWAHWLTLAATVGLLAVFARSVDWGHAWSAIIHADPALLGLATIANLASLAVKGLRWGIFLDAVGMQGTGQAIRATIVCAALNNVLVANGGDAARIAAMSRRGNVSSAVVLATVVVDRFCDLITYAAMFVAAAFILPLPPQLARWRTPGLLALGTIAAIVGVLVWRSPSNGAGDSHEKMIKPELALSRARRYWHRLIATSATVATAPRLAIAIALALVAWLGQWATFHYAAHSASFAITASGSLLALLAVNTSFLVRLTPGNVGVFQLLYALAAASAGLDKDSAVAVAFLIQLIQYVPVTVLGLLLAPSLATRKATSNT